MNDNDKTVRKESVPPMSSGTHEQGGPLLETGMMQPPQTPGTLGMIGKYQVVRILGEGGMGQVLLAREPVTDSLVAIKIIKPEYLKKDWAVHRFLTEARHMFKMSHPSMIRVLEVSDRPEGPYFVMPYMAGGSLAQKIKPGEALPPDTILPLARQVAEALQYAHGRGIIHRDLKTSNILLDPEGRAYLCDFGLLRTVFNDSMVDVTKPQVEGTVPYMSPAIAGGKAEDTRCDIYAFGCLLYEMLTGQPPYQGPTVDAILKQIQAGPPQPIRQLNSQAPARLVAIAEHAMGRELRDRYSTMADVINDLDRAAQGKEPLGPHGRANGSHLRRNVLAALVIVALLGLAAFGLSKLPGGKDGSLAATPQDQFTWTTNNGTIAITRPTRARGAITIPSTINGLPVTSVDAWAFQACGLLTQVTIPASITNIAGSLLYGCCGVTSIVVDARNPVYLNSADGVVFNRKMTQLVSYPTGKSESYVIPNSVTSIGDGAFINTKLTNVTIPNSVTAIGNCAFVYSGVTSITIPNSVTHIGAWTFYGCSSLTNVVIPNSIKEIGENALAGCSSLASVMISNGVTAIGGLAFSGCGALKSITIPDSVTYLGGAAFEGTGLTNVTIPKSVTSIEDNPFGSCGGLNSIMVDAANPAYSSSADGVLFDKKKTLLINYPGGKAGHYEIPSGVTGIGKGAFAGCPYLTGVTIPESVTMIDANAFNGCQNLTGIYFKGNAPRFGQDMFAGVKKATIYYQPGTTGWGKEFGGLPTAPWNPQASNAASPAATAQSQFTCTTNNGAITVTKYTGPGGAVTIPSTINGLPVTGVGGGAFAGCTKLTSVTIPGSATNIGERAFAECENLTSVTIPAGITRIENHAFFRCHSLASATIPASVTSIDYASFAECFALPAIVVDAANLAYCSVDGVVFNKDKTCIVSCPGGKAGSYTIPNSVTQIGDCAFRGCTKLTSVTIPNSVTNFGMWAFGACDKLTSMTIPSGVSSIGWAGLVGCNLTNLTLPSSLTTISRWTFGFWPNLTNFAIPNSVTQIDTGAFEGCSALASVTIPNSVTRIDGRAFFRCSGLSSIVVDAANPAYSSSADGVLFNKEKTCLVIYPAGKAGGYVIPNGVTRIGDAAFQNCTFLTSVTIPETVTDLGAEAFRGCENLTAVYFKGNAPRLGKDVFEDNPKLKIYYLSDKSGWGGEFGGRPTKIWSGQTSSLASLMPPVPTARPLSVRSANATGVQNDFTWTVNNNAVTITKYKGQGGAVTIPSEINGLPVTVIGNWAFRDCVALTSVTIPESVTAMGWCVFHNCAGLTNASISKSVATINGNPFPYCTSLTAIEVDAANPAFTSVDGTVYDKAKTRLQCYPCGRRGNYQIPEGVSAIGAFAFEGSDKVTGVTIPSSVKEVGACAFKNCTRLAYVNIPEGVTQIRDNVFNGCLGLRKMALPKSLALVELNPFVNCTNLGSVEVHAENPNFASKDGVLFDKAGTRLICHPGGKGGSYDVPKGVSVIGGGAFGGSGSMTGVTLPDGVTCLESWAFAGCHRLAGISFPLGLTTIRDHAFNDCFSLASITIPDSVTTIDDAAFASCTKLASIRFPSRITRIAPWMCWNCPNLTAVTIPASVTSIGEIAFQGCSRLESITIPNSVTEIGLNAFYGCMKLAGIAIPDSVVKIGEYAFGNCDNLATVTFGNRLVSVGNSCFRACALTQITLPSSVTTLGSNPFVCCEKLASISVNAGNSFFCSVDGVLFNKEKTTLIGYPGGKPGGYTVPAGVTKIGKWAFHYNPRLTSVTIPESVRTIEDGAFQWCGNLVGVKFTGDAPAVGGYVFDGDNKATIGYLPGRKGWGKEFAGRPVHPMSGDFAYAEENNTMTIARYLGAGGAVIIPDRINGIPVATIGASAFSGCIDVTRVTIPKGVMTIRGWAFYGCTRLAKVNIPESVTSISLGAFYLCPSLASIKIPASVTSLDRASFSYDTALKSITVAPANPSYCSSSEGVLFSKDKTRLISYPCGRAGSYVIPKGVTTIGPNAFEGADKLTGVTIPDTVRAIESWAFLACSGLTGVTIPHSVTTIAGWAFQNCTNLAKVTLENGVVNIGDGAFWSCSKLASITIPNSVQRIGDKVFSASSLTDVRIPSSVTSIGINPLDVCSNLRSITVDSANPAYCSKDGALLNKDMTCLISFATAAPRSYEVPNTVTNIGDSAFAGCYRLTGVTLPGKLVRLGSGAFWGCTNLTSVYCKGNAPAVGGDVFAAGTDKATVYYLPGTTGWGRDLAGRPTAEWKAGAK